MKKMISGMGKTLALVLLLASQLVAQRKDTVSIMNFGLQPDTRQNATPYFIRALDSCRQYPNAVLVIPPGRYDFWPQYARERIYFESNTTDNNPKRLGIDVKNMTGLTIDGQGALLVYHDRMQPITIDSSQQVTIKNLQIDWDIPLTAQAKVIAATGDHIDLQINLLESPYLLEKGKLVFVGEGWKSQWWGVMEFDGSTRLIPQGTGDSPCLGDGWENYTATELAPGIVRLQYAFRRLPAVGNMLVLRHNERDHAGIFINESSQVQLEQISVFHTAGLGILSQYSADLTMRQVVVGPNRAKGRFLSGHDDGLHFSNCRGAILVDNCEFEGLMDDPINVHGTSVRIIEKINDHRLRCQFMEKQSVGLYWARSDELIGFIAHSGMNTIGTGRVIEFSRLNNEQFEIEFEGQVPATIKAGDALENLSWTPEVTIRNSRFKSNRARGILVSTPGKVVIAHNQFQSSGSAILIAGDANYWYETGGVRDVLIEENDFEYPCLSSNYQFCEGIISIMPEIPELDMKAPCYHRNIRILNNRFHPFDYPILYAFSVDGLEFAGNTIERSYGFKPYHSRKYGLTFKACRNVSVRSNNIIGDVLGKSIHLENTSKQALNLRGEKFFRMSVQ